MIIQLDPGSEAILSRLVAGGEYSSTSEAVAAAVQLLEAEVHRRRKHAELRDLIGEGVQSANLGELYDGEEVFAEILRELDERPGSGARSP
jgi:putative addiction module CopG family antidote